MSNRFTRVSIKTKITGIVLVLFVSCLWLLAYSVEERLSRDMAELLEAQQFSTVSYVASDLDDKIRQRVQLVAAVASLITPEMLADPAKVRAFLSNRFGLLSLFKGGVVIVAMDGRGFADYPPSPDRSGAFFGDLEYFHEVLATGRPVIGKPRISRFSKKPGVPVAAPIKDRSGRLTGLLVGFATFSDDALFGLVERAKVGKTGYLTISAPKYNLIATSSDPARIFQPMAKRGANGMQGRLAAGFEGSGIAVDSRGVETLTSAKRIPSAGWLVQAVLPTAEAFAPIQEMKFRAYSLAMALTLFVLISVWLAIRQLLNPLIAASNRMGDASSGEPQPLPVKYLDEVGQLLSKFNALTGERNRAYEALRDSEQRFRNILEHAPIGMAVVALEGRFVMVNRALCEIVGYEKAELERLNYRAITFPDDLEADLDHERRLLDRRDNSFLLEKRLVRKDGLPVWTQLTDYVQRDGAGAPLYFIKQIEDISERRQSQEQIRQLVFYDALTKLPNRRLLKDRLKQALTQAKRYDRSFALMFLDLDHFKQINDTFGHDFGDELLKLVASRLLGCVRSADTVCRQGGDEFIIVLTEMSNRQDAVFVAEKIIAAISRPIRIRGHELLVTTSIGIAVYPVNGVEDAKVLMKHADMAMYEAKSKGRNGFSIYPIA